MSAFKNEYEVERDERIAANKRKMEELGIFRAKADFEALIAVSKPAPRRLAKARKPEGIELQSEVRRSKRDRPAVNYCEEAKDPSARCTGSRVKRSAMKLDREDVDFSNVKSPKIRSNFDSGKGVRVQGGRVYDSKLGVTCHWCRQKTVENKVTCTQPDCGLGRRLPISFCRRCLHNRHGEDVHEAEASGKWVCPSCRGSCGEGCTKCCNCGPCRKKAGLAPTHQVVNEARDIGFNNVHDFLIHKVTGESAAAISKRKENAAWWHLRADEPEFGQAAEAQEQQEACPSTPVNTTAKDAVPAAGSRPKVQATIDEPYSAVKSGTKANLASDKDKVPRVAARKLRAMRAVGLMAPVAA